MKKIFSFRNYSIILFLSLNQFFAQAQSGIDPAFVTVMQHALDSLREQNQVKGMYAALYIPGKGMWQGVTGVSYGTHSIDTNMLFDIGSITKTFVASEIMKLVEEGMFSLDDSIGNLLPPMEFVTPEVTVRELLQHKSGLAEYLSTAWSNAMFDDLTRRWYPPEAMDSFLTAPTGLPGGPFAYRNTNYVLLGMIAEHFRGDSLHKILRNDFLTPLELDNTFMEMFEPYSNEVADNWSTPTLDPDLAVNVSGYPHEAMFTSTSFAGGFFCAAPDLATWGYNLYSGHVLSDSSLNEMLTFNPASGGYFNGYGLGCMRMIGGGETYYGHAGNYFGYAASMLYHPEDSLCLALLVNQDCISPYIAMPLMKTALDNFYLTTSVGHQLGEQKIHAFPNPVSETFYVSFPANHETMVQLFDMEGRQVYNSIQYTDYVRINTDKFQEGMYLLKVVAGNTTTTQKIIVER